jgi:hypothetical protein
VRLEGLGKLKDIHSLHRVSNPRPSSLLRCALTTTLPRASVTVLERCIASSGDAVNTHIADDLVDIRASQQRELQAPQTHRTPTVASAPAYAYQNSHVVYATQLLLHCFHRGHVTMTIWATKGLTVYIGSIPHETPFTILNKLWELTVVKIPLNGANCLPQH